MKAWHHWMLRGLAMTTGIIGLAWGTTTASANSINTYISNQGYSTPKITKAIWSGFPKYNYRHNKPEGVVVHETANPHSTLTNEVTCMKNNYQNAFVHTFVDASSIVNIANTKYLCWGAGPIANNRYVQFEQVEVHSKAAFASELNNAAYYTAYILKQSGLTPKRYTTVLSHHDVSNNLGGTNHSDPDAYWSNSAKNYFGTTYTMTDFVALVKMQYAKLTGSSTTTDTTTDENQHTTAPVAPKPKTVTYNKATNNETATLSTNYTKWSVYNHVKGTKGAAKIGWGRLSADHRGAKVYVDNRAVKKGGWSGTWYRIRFSKNTKTKYWVYSGVLTFPKVTYSNASGSATLAPTHAPLYNHVLNSNYLSKKVAYTNSFPAGTKVTINKKGDKASDGSTWFRITLNNKSYWIQNTNLAGQA
ncbi:N-acetylmuramoyl-L-alanine amidase [Levilactobacillus senmaizukei DSM 21775 = NBRC 103853]|uniref:N-acetylmuramoyl-L-alanine amidase n=1 Tax=Levilactobacillus senmaizukei DSM 21775 = NBRC 103853 TaxID=1423803 RepID=A0A0R2DDW5_9LACO|nr:peptidoglycan recognition family protein [Levilactobacillus senmaizukei]KRN02114.1 N-acetylmuramoyl-L-alanine amidase [Levilactobacillus senmaizukei DSM 21775 = NBRC 103853]